VQLPAVQLPVLAKHTDGGVLQAMPEQGSVEHVPLVHGPPEHIVVCWVYAHTPPVHAPTGS
jgi:hypothetical protein